MPESAAKIPAHALECCPPEPGAHLPALPLVAADGKPFELPSVADHPRVLVIYRGGWCTHCNRQLKELRDLREEFAGIGCRLVGICPDRPELIRAWVEEHRPGFPIHSDHAMAAATRLGLAYRLDDEGVAAYKAKGIDLEAASGETHHMLPMAALLLVESDGFIRYVYAHPDHAERMPGDVLLAIARTALSS